MVQIKEYTQREGLQPVNRGALNIQKPRIMAEGRGLELSEKPLDTAHQLAKLGVEMKERRDDAMVSEFANQYAIEEARQINDFKQNYQGLNAHKIMDKYNEWRDEYLAKYSSYDNNSDDDNEHVYLENAEQVNKMKNTLARSHVSMINSLSNYIGSQEESARKNALTASIQNEVEKISLEDIPENIELYGENIKASLSALYKGQSEEFINQKAKSMMNAAVSGNLMRVAANDPAKAIDLYGMSLYQKNMDNDTKMKVKSDIQKMYQTKLASAIAEPMALENIKSGNNIDPAAQEAAISAAIDASLSNEFFDNIDKVEYKNKVKKDALGRIAKITKDTIDAGSTIQNDALLEMSAVIKDGDTWQVNGISEKNFANIVTTYNGKATYELINNIAKQSDNTKNLLFWRYEPIPPTSEQIATYHQAIDKIKNGTYKVAGDMSSDINALPENLQKDILSKFIRNYDYNKKAKDLKARTGIDADKKIKESYTFVSGLDPVKSAPSFDVFKDEIMLKLYAQQASGEKLTEENIRKAATDAWGEIRGGKSNVSMAQRLITDTDRYIKDNASRGDIIGYDYRLEAATEVLDDTSFSYDIGAETRKELAKYIVNGDVAMITATLDMALQSEAKVARRKKREREETDKQVKAFYDELFDFSNEQ